MQKNALAPAARNSRDRMETGGSAAELIIWMILDRCAGQEPRSLCWYTITASWTASSCITSNSETYFTA